MVIQKISAKGGEKVEDKVQPRDSTEKPTVFISYSHKDEEFTKRVHGRMRDDKLKVWYAPEDIQGGKFVKRFLSVVRKVRKVRPPEPYKGKGIRYVDEYVRRKAGKAGVPGASA